MKISQAETTKMSLHGINLDVDPLNNSEVDICRVTTEKGHFQEFWHKTSTFVYYIISGSGTFYLNGEATEVKAGDVVMAVPGTKIYYLGKLEMLLITTPAWKEEDEIHVRFIDQPAE